MSKANKKSGKLITAISIGLVVIATATAGLLLIDWNKSKNGEKTLIFTSKTDYKYPEIVRFDDFQISIDNVTKFPEKPDEKLAKIDCYELPVRDVKDPLDGRDTDFEKSLITSKYKYDYLIECLDAKADDETPQIWVEFKVKNVSGAVSSLDPYRFSVIGDSSIKELRRNIKSGEMTPDEERNFKIDFEYNRHYEGSFRLLIVKDNKSKNLEFNWPLGKNN